MPKFKLQRTIRWSNGFLVRKCWIYDFDLSNGCSSNKECTEGSSYLGNDELHPQELKALDREITSAVEASSSRGSSGRGSSDECEDDEDMVSYCFRERGWRLEFGRHKKEANSRLRDYTTQLWAIDIIGSAPPPPLPILICYLIP